MQKFSPFLALRQLARCQSFASSTIHAPPTSVYSRVRDFVISNQNLQSPAITSLSIEPKAAISKIQEELLEQLEANEINYNEMKTRVGKLTTKEAPNLIPFNEDRRVVGCICLEAFHHVSYLLLYKGIPKRCRCGHWFQLVDFDAYEAARDRYWTRVKIEPENAKLMKDLDDSEAELKRLLESSKTMTNSSVGANTMLDDLAIQWMKYKESYYQIRKIIDEACITDIR